MSSLEVYLLSKENLEYMHVVSYLFIVHAETQELYLHSASIELVSEIVSGS